MAIRTTETFVVVEKSAVVLTTPDIEVAKAKLLAFGNEGAPPSRMICGVQNNKVQEDPHTCGGQNQGAGMAAGFNKWWQNWDDIRRMNAIAQTAVDSWPDKYVIVDQDKVIGITVDLQFAKERLLELGHEGSPPSRMICGVKNGKVQDDPHTCGGENQGSAMKAGFNKWWQNWDDIRRMNAIAQAAIDYPDRFAVVFENDVTFISESLEEAKAKLLTYGNEGKPPSRMICGVKRGKVQADPHTVGGENQGAAMAAGFNKWWLNWDDINRMNAIAQAVIDYPENYVVVYQSSVTLITTDIEAAKAKLLTYGNEGSPPSRMICGVKTGQVQYDPHTIAGQDQGSAMKAGFNKWWQNWDDINRMNAIAQTKMDSLPDKYIVVEDWVAVMTTYDLEAAKARLIAFGNTDKPPARLVCGVKKDIVQPDPHTVAGQDQGAGMKAGFNKWWLNWTDIHRRNAIAQADTI